jgi:hypothetical protein
MIARICLILALLAAIPGWSQTDTPATGTQAPAAQNGAEDADNQVTNTGMLTPPPVTGEAYAAAPGNEVRNNYLTLGVTSTAGYDDNVAAGYSTIPESDMIYSFWPTVSLDKNTLRIREKFNYSPGFTFYEPHTLHNASDQNASANITLHPSETTTISMLDSFVRSSTLYNQPNGSSGGAVTGGTPGQVVGAIAPFADRITNSADVELSDQPGENQMIGMSGQYSQLDYPDASQVQGLYNSNSYSVGAFGSDRLSGRQYFGGNVQHSRVVSYLKVSDSVLQSDNIFGFYTIYLRNSPQSVISISVTGGPEHYTAVQIPEPSLEAWAPAVTVAVGMQQHLWSMAVNYSHNVTAGGGLPGAYREESVHGFYRRELTPTWDINVSGIYALNTNITPKFPLAEPGGHTMTIGVSAEHRLTRSLTCTAGYDRMQESYSGVGALSQFPNSNREYGSITWQFSRPLGR